MKPDPIKPKPGQESVWDYPRPAIAEPTKLSLRVEFADRVIAQTSNGVRTLETSHPPTYYFPEEDVDISLLHRTEHGSFCEWKGKATYFDVVVGQKSASNAAWTYPAPSNPFAMISRHIAFYPALMQACFVNDEPVIAQPGGFYGGWVTSHVAGPFKGGPGSWGW
ncbi:MAG: DUF427 domain-containing protein [Pseudomonadota bacterium]